MAGSSRERLKAKAFGGLEVRGGQQAADLFNEKMMQSRYLNIQMSENVRQKPGMSKGGLTGCTNLSLHTSTPRDRSTTAAAVVLQESRRWAYSIAPSTRPTCGCSLSTDRVYLLSTALLQRSRIFNSFSSERALN